MLETSAIGPGSKGVRIWVTCEWTADWFARSACVWTGLTMWWIESTP